MRQLPVPDPGIADHRSADGFLWWLAHRPGPAPAALCRADVGDRVAVVADGVISELGSHDELVGAGGSYAALWDSRHGAADHGS